MTSLISFITSLRLEWPDGKITTTSVGNHSGHSQNENDKDVNRVIDCYFEQEKCLKSGEMYYERYGIKNFIIKIDIDSGKELIEKERKKRG